MIHLESGWCELCQINAWILILNIIRFEWIWQEIYYCLHGALVAVSSAADCEYGIHKGRFVRWHRRIRIWLWVQLACSTDAIQFCEVGPRHFALAWKVLRIRALRRLSFRRWRHACFFTYALGRCRRNWYGSLGSAAHPSKKIITRGSHWQGYPNLQDNLACRARILSNRYLWQHHSLTDQHTTMWFASLHLSRRQQETCNTNNAKLPPPEEGSTKCYNIKMWREVFWRNYFYCWGIRRTFRWLPRKFPFSVGCLKVNCVHVQWDSSECRCNSGNGQRGRCPYHYNRKFLWDGSRIVLRECG